MRTNSHQPAGVDEGRESREGRAVGEFELKEIRRPLAAYNVVAAIV